MKNLILSLLVIVPFAAYTQQYNEDNPPPTAQPPTVGKGDGIIWEEEYIEPVPAPPPNGPTKIPPRSVKLRVDVVSVQSSSDQSLDGLMQVTARSDLKLNKRTVQTGEQLQVELQKNLAVKRDGQTATLTDVRSGSKCLVVGWQRRDGVIEIGRIELQR